MSLLYHRQLDEAWEQAAQTLKQRLNDEGFNLNLIGRARKQKKGTGSRLRTRKGTG